MALLYDGLLPATFRGVPFAVRSSSAQFGRRQVVHQYPGRDTPWVEDMGRGARRIRFQGFLVTDDVVYAGGPVAAQRALLIAAAEQKGPGTLTHPTLGVLTVSLNSCDVGEALDAGRYSEIAFDFVESGTQSFPSLLSISGAQIGGIALTTIATVLLDTATVLRAALALAPTSILPASPWAAKVIALGNDATALNSLAAQLPGQFGRFSAGGNAGFAGSSTTAYSSATTVDDLIADASAQRAAIRAASSTLTATVGPDAVGAAAAALVAALLAACADPADALRLFGDLAAFDPAGDAVTAAYNDLFHRLAVIALVQAAAAYQPTSYDDAFSRLQAITALLDAEITTAGDAGLDATFDALRALRVATVTDLRERGGALARIRLYTVAGSLPAVRLAQRLYRDPTRADQLVQQVDPLSPLFMPFEFEALAA